MSYILQVANKLYPLPAIAQQIEDFAKDMLFSTVKGGITERTDAVALVTRSQMVLDLCVNYHKFLGELKFDWGAPDYVLSGINFIYKSCLSHLWRNNLGCIFVLPCLEGYRNAHLKVLGQWCGRVANEDFLFYEQSYVCIECILHAMLCWIFCSLYVFLVWVEAASRCWCFWKMMESIGPWLLVNGLVMPRYFILTGYWLRKTNKRTSGRGNGW